MWSRLDDQFCNHPKARRAGQAGRELFISALTYSAAELTDGFIHPEDLVFLGARVDIAAEDVEDVAATLVSVGLWEPTADGFIIHDYHEYNPTRAQMLEDRQQAKERMRYLRQIKSRPAVPCSPELRPNISRTNGELRQNLTDPTPTPTPTPTTKKNVVRGNGENDPSSEGHECSPEQRPNGDRTERGNAPPLLMVGGRDEDGERQKAVVAEAARLANLSPEQLATEAAERRARLQPLVEATE